MSSISVITKSSALAIAATLSVHAETIVFGFPPGNLQTDYDVPGVLDVSVAAIPPSSSLGTFPGFNDLPVALFTDAGAGVAITLAPQPGFSVTLQSFDLGNFLGFGGETGYAVYDLSNLSSPLISVGPFTVPFSDSSHPTYNVNLTSSTGLELVVGPDLFDIGLNNIVFSTSRTGPVGTPDAGSTSALLGLGIAGLTLLRRANA